MKHDFAFIVIWTIFTRKKIGLSAPKTNDFVETYRAGFIDLFTANTSREASDIEQSAAMDGVQNSVMILNRLSSLVKSRRSL